ncbi:hypothetical protein HYE40_01540 [Mycoplasmopsis bovis]|nr:hypothetical protein [Mycoplasmopsis bovis]QQH20866.1 hypothetical protein HYE40_01540 [Mycoplasmopsis bovis]
MKDLKKVERTLGKFKVEKEPANRNGKAIKRFGMWRNRDYKLPWNAYRGTRQEKQKKQKRLGT